MFFFQKLEKEFEIYAVCSNAKFDAPGRKFDELLAKFHPCPTFIVYSGNCQRVSGASISPLLPGSFIVIPANRVSEFDLSPEALHAAELWKLKNRSKDDVITNDVSAIILVYVMGILAVTTEGEELLYMGFNRSQPHREYYDCA